MKKLNMDFWRAVFEEQIRKVKPRDDWRLKMDQNLDFHNVEPRWKRSLQEHAHARFTCSQCRHTWSSHQIVILFHMHWERHERQGWVEMRVFRQQCQRCFSPKHEEPQFTEQDIEAILKRLIISIRKDCYRERIDDSELPAVIWGTSGPHQRGYCEACQLGLHKGHYGRPQGEVQKPHSPWSSGNSVITIPNSAVTQAPPSKDWLDPICCCIGFLFFIGVVGIFISYWNWSSRRGRY